MKNGRLIYIMAIGVNSIMLSRITKQLQWNHRIPPETPETSETLKEIRERFYHAHPWMERFIFSELLRRPDMTSEILRTFRLRSPLANIIGVETGVHTDDEVCELYLYYRYRTITPLTALDRNIPPIEVEIWLQTSSIGRNPGLCMPIIRQYRHYPWDRFSLSYCTQLGLPDLRELDEGDFHIVGKWFVEMLVRNMRIRYDQIDELLAYCGEKENASYYRAWYANNPHCTAKNIIEDIPKEHLMKLWTLPFPQRLIFWYWPNYPAARWQICRTCNEPTWKKAYPWLVGIARKWRLAQIKK